MIESFPGPAPKGSQTTPLGGNLSSLSSSPRPRPHSVGVGQRLKLGSLGGQCPQVSWALAKGWKHSVRGPQLPICQDCQRGGKEEEAGGSDP